MHMRVGVLLYFCCGLRWFHGRYSIISMFTSFSYTLPISLFFHNPVLFYVPITFVMLLRRDETHHNTGMYIISTTISNNETILVTPHYTFPPGEA